MVPITRRASSLLYFCTYVKRLEVPVLLLSSCASEDSLRCWLSDRCSSLALLSSSVSRANLSRLVAASLSSLALLFSSVSMANLSCLLETTFSSLSFLSNSFSSPRFNLLRVARRCFSWSSVSDDLFFS